MALFLHRVLPVCRCALGLPTLTHGDIVLLRGGHEAVRIAFIHPLRGNRGKS